MLLLLSLAQTLYDLFFGEVAHGTLLTVCCESREGDRGLEIGTLAGNCASIFLLGSVR